MQLGIHDIETLDGGQRRFDPNTVAMLRGVLDDVTRSMLAERILKAAEAGERSPAKLRAHAIAEGLEAGLQSECGRDGRLRSAASPPVSNIKTRDRRPAHGYSFCRSLKSR
jgi:hypothetical protein